MQLKLDHWALHLELDGLGWPSPDMNVVYARMGGKRAKKWQKRIRGRARVGPCLTAAALQRLNAEFAYDPSLR